MSFKEMRERMAKSDASKQILGSVQSNYVPDERFWTPAKDKDGNGVGLIRFLPAPEGETEDMVKYFTHYIHGEGKKKYVERCLTTIGQADPAEELAQRLGANDKKEYGKYGRSARFIANVVVLNDPAKPENNGKIKYYEFGIKVFKKLQARMVDSEDPIEPVKGVNIFCPWAGANFKVVLGQQGGNNNYDDSKFMEPTPLFGGDEAKIEALWKTAPKLRPLVDASTFKTYEELSKNLAAVLGDLVKAKTPPAASAPDLAPAVGVGSPATPATPAPAAAATGAAEADPNKVFEELLGAKPPKTTDQAIEDLFAEGKPTQ